MSFYSVGIGALNAAQLGLTTAGHNIANVNTSGYHRQVISQATNVPLQTGSGFIGQGVKVDTIRRVYSEFLDSQVVRAQTEFSELSTYLSQISQIDNIVADPNSGLSPALQDFFKAMNDVATNPASVPSRQALLSSASSMITRFETLSQRFDEIRTGINGQLRESVSLINSYAQQIANINEQIVRTTSSSTQPPNDFFDLRDDLIAKLNEQVRATTVLNSDGTFNVFIGKGQPLVVGGQVFQLAAVPNPDDQSQTDVAYAAGSTNILLGTSSLEGGVLGGLLNARNDALNVAQNALGAIAVTLAETFNGQHAMGVDLNGAMAGNFFKPPAPTVIANINNASTSGLLGAEYADTSKLNTDDYRILFDGTNYQVTNLTTNLTTSMTAAQLTAPNAIPGLTLTAPAPVAAGDVFTLRPTRNGARDIALSNTISTTTIAAAAPMIASATTSNSGSGKVSPGTVVNAPYNNVTITFNGAGTAFDVVDQTSGKTLATDVNYIAGRDISYNGWTFSISGTPAAGDVFTVQNGTVVESSAATVSALTLGMPPNVQNPVTITFTNATTFNVVENGPPSVNLATGVTYSAGQSFSYNGWTLQITGVPATGDTFTVGPNTNGISDNRNALLLSALQTANTMVNGTTSYQGAYSQMVGYIGSKTLEAQATTASQESLLTNAKNTQQQLSGVNLDEEAASLLRYQQAYQAAAKMMQIANNTFDILIDLAGN